MGYEKPRHQQPVENQIRRRAFQDEDHKLTSLFSICWPNYPGTALLLIPSKSNMIYRDPSLNVPKKQISLEPCSMPNLEEPTTPEKEQLSKGKHASSTQNRRMVWENIIWPLILDVNRSYFTLKEYHSKRDKFCDNKKIQSSKVAGGFVSLLVKGILIRQKSIYSIHYRLIPYMRKKANLEYGQAIRETSTKR